MPRQLPAVLTLILIAALWIHGPIAQFADYHQFADQGSVLGMPHAADVLSNGGFALVAVWGLWKLQPLFCGKGWQPGRYGYGLFLAGLLLTTAGSGYYHLAPDNARLVWDRLPVALTCAGLLAATRAKYHPHPSRESELRDTLLLAFGAIAGVLWWRITDLRGAGDLRWYLLFQILPMVLIPLWQAMADAPRARRLAIAAAIVLYGAAKLAELYDHQLQNLLHVISGHTLKHLLAAIAAAVLLPASERRTT
ncbi:MAG TPA: hypothetical protein VF798_02930 [Burkholderiaceae bacterium]